MHITVINPQNSILKEVIQYFIFIEKKSTKRISQVCYPNTNHCLSLMENSKLEKLSDTYYQVTPSRLNTSYLTGIYKKPITISSKIPYRELCINFNPLGLETLFGKKLSALIFKHAPLDCIKNNIFNKLFEMAFSNTPVQENLHEIESFLISLIRDDYVDYQNLNLDKIVASMSIENVSDTLCKSYRSTHRFFTENLNLTPKTFLQVKKVRSAMELLFKDKSITEISYDLDFSDQSHFIKTFQQYTQLTPSKFRKMALNVDDTLIWKINT